MRNKLKLFFYNYRTWIYNLQYIFVSLILLVIVTHIDHSTAEWVYNLPRVLFTGLDLAKTVLSSLSAGLLSITIFGFSTILSVLVFYSGNFSSQVVENFVGKKITMKVLGIFMGGFIYCIGSLNFMRSYDEARYVLAGTVGVIYVAFCVVYMIVFIQETIKSVNVINVISDIFEETLPVIEEEVGERDHDYLKDKLNEEHLSIKSDTSGYFEYFNTSEAIGKLKDFSGTFVVTPITGDFVVEGQEIGEIHIENFEEYEELGEDLKKLYHIQDNQISITNYRYGIDKIVQIGIQGLSSGIKDPSTTIHCIRILSILLSKLASVNPNHHIEKLENEGTIYQASYTFKDDFSFALMPIINLGKEHAQLMSAVFEGFTIMSSKATSINRDLLVELGENIYKETIKDFTFQSDKEVINKNYERFLSVCGGREEY